MKKPSRKNPNARVRRNPVLMFIIIILLTVIALGASIYLSRRPFRNGDLDQPTNNPSGSDSSVSIEEPNDDTSDINLDNPIQYEGEDPNDLETITGTITTARVSGSVVLIRVNIDQYLASGACTINLTSNDDVYTETVKINVAAATSTCEGFSIPLSSLKSGTWNIDIAVSSDDKQGKISGKIQI